LKPSMAEPGQHHVGTFARVTGLERTPHLNGEISELVRQTDAGRWIVRVRNSRRLKALRAENLNPAASGIPDFARRGLGGAAIMTAHLLLELLRSGGSRSFSVSLIPASVLLWIIATLGGCFWLHSPLTTPEALLPGISEMGIAPPARALYRGGSTLVGLLLAVTIRLYSILLLPQLADSIAAGRAAESANMGYVAALGVALQGLFTLETALSAQTLLHFAGAIAFVLGTMWHADASNALFSDIGDSVLAASPYAKASVAIRRTSSEGLAALLLLVPVGLQVWQWVTGTDGKGSRFQNVIGVAQWALVMNFAVFYCSYCFDFWVVLEAT